jgi:glutamate synthase domain-containing protein 2
VTLIITGGLRVPADFIKALCLGADGVAISNSAIQSIGCVAARQCHTNTCPSGVATQDPDLASLLDPEQGAKQLFNFFDASKKLLAVMARACGHDDLKKFNLRDIATFKKDVAELAGIPYAGVGQIPTHFY